jgi:hypothetical protein
VDNLYADVLIGDITEEEFRLKLIQLTPVVMSEEENDISFSQPDWTSDGFEIEKPLRLVASA